MSQERDRDALSGIRARLELVGGRLVVEDADKHRMSAVARISTAAAAGLR